MYSVVFNVHVHACIAYTVAGIRSILLQLKVTGSLYARVDLLVECPKA